MDRVYIVKTRILGHDARSDGVGIPTPQFFGPFVGVVGVDSSGPETTYRTRSVLLTGHLTLENNSACSVPFDANEKFCASNTAFRRSRPQMDRNVQDRTGCNRPFLYKVGTAGPESRITIVEVGRLMCKGWASNA